MSDRLPRESRAERLARETHINVLVAAGRFTDELEQLCRAEGISHPQYVALWALCLAEDPDAGIPISAVADGLLNRASDTTRLVDRLERSGLAERLPNPGDRRGVLVRATAKGHDAFARVTPRLRAFHRAQWSQLTADEVTELNELLRKVLWSPN
ncbi:MAG: MarR family transcriptional regulator [Acidimicrobiia bacterium]|nr:MarR family transcriptional regulator [Acidimicrobiia bacterium]